MDDYICTARKNYQSPIRIHEQIIRDKMIEEENSVVMTAVRKIAADIDEEELMKALQYDCQQYDVGYRDGWYAAMEYIKQFKDDMEEITDEL